MLPVVGVQADQRRSYFLVWIFRGLFSSYCVWIEYPNPLQLDLSIVLKLDLCDKTALTYFIMKADYEDEWIRLVAQGLRWADSFVDVGSNLGVYSVTIAQAYPSKKVLAIEPLASNLSALNEHVIANKVHENCHTIGAAVSSCQGKVMLFTNPLRSGGATIVPDKQARGASEFVASVTLDSLITEKSVVKIDVEGAEIDIVNSGLGVLGSDMVAVVVVEVSPRTVDEAVMIFDQLSFDCFGPGGQTIEIGSQTVTGVSNIVAVKRGSREYSRISF